MHRRITAAAMSAVLLLAALTGCEKPAAGSAKVGALKGPTAMGMVRMMSRDEDDKTGLYDFSVMGAADEITVGLQNKTLDIAAVPCNLASVLYNRMEGGVTVIAVNTLGVLYVVDTTGAVESIEDLRGKTLYSTGLGTTPEYALGYILQKNGLTPGIDLTIEYKSESTELGALLAAGELELCVLPQPYITTVLGKNEKARVALSLTEEWDRVQPDFGLLTGCVVVRTEYLTEHPDAVQDFLKNYEQSVRYINENAAEAAALVERYDIAPAAVAEKAIPECNIVFITGAEMKTQLSGYLGVLYEADAKSVGGALPDDAFYYRP